MLISTLLITFLYLFNTISSAIVGKPCYHKYKNMQGVCKSPIKCPTLKQDRKNKVPYQKCIFSVIVCCTENKIGDKSIQMCKKYENITYAWKNEPTLIGGQNAPTKHSICPWENSGFTVIYDGAKTFLGEFPHMALIGFGKENVAWKCGGTLISEKFVLTAAHCLHVKGYGEAQLIRLGDLNYTDSTDDEYTQTIPIKKTIPHPKYIHRATYHDIALIRLKYNAKLSIYVRPACIYTKEDISTDKVIATGWGYTENNVQSDYLLKATLDIFDLDHCARVYGVNGYFPMGLLDNVQICFGSRQNRSDTCPGDSGGPIQIYNKDFHCSYYVVAVTSHGKKCGHNNVPAVYVRLYPYIEWIESIVWS